MQAFQRGHCTRWLGGEGAGGGPPGAQVPGVDRRLHLVVTVHLPEYVDHKVGGTVDGVAEYSDALDMRA